MVVYKFLIDHRHSSLLKDVDIRAGWRSRMVPWAQGPIEFGCLSTLYRPEINVLVGNEVLHLFGGLCRLPACQLRIDLHTRRQGLHGLCCGLMTGAVSYGGGCLAAIDKLSVSSVLPQLSPVVRDWPLLML